MFAVMKSQLFRLPGLTSFREDAPAGVVVFLVALPLCLGIALASGAPLFSGIIAGVVGGLIVCLFSDSELSVSGPAAGLAAIVLSTIQSVPSFQAFLLIVVLAGIFQVLISFIKAGYLANFIPHNVIKGMLAAIGILIIVKQIPHAVGYDHSFVDEDMAFAGNSWLDLFLDPFHALQVFEPGAIIISVFSFAILIAWESKAVKSIRASKYIPAALVCVALAVILNQLYVLFAPSLALTAANKHLVELPVPSSLHDLKGLFTFPDFSVITQSKIWVIAATIAAVASIESLLSVEATDKMDPLKRITNTDRELFAQGIGNITSGLLGGIPITSVIVRSSANIYAGARSKLSTMIHGMLLLLSVVFIPVILNLIPLAALASILIVVGYKLSSVTIIRSVAKEGAAQFLPFLVTTVLVVIMGILWGVAIGLLVSLYFVVRANINKSTTMVSDGNKYMLQFRKDITFIHKPEIKRCLHQIPNGTELIIDGTKARVIAHDIYETIRDFADGAEYRDITIEYLHYFNKENKR